ncbi:MAG: tetratricopeptide repeat protein [Phenylobacterium sp.]|uniref:O-linked N-acetylglucosamine transferase, SPINDLY family protein n=1 Tax=Phenylobacterium sp. TaxID=1871053 RepID=UPI001A5CF4A7|nr:glycosyltransferase family 41 protein [Phenylobacterium sp.]MBL8555521.1 tetratricopeptide repeat protein [Phenylobacterium sp.]
MVDRLAAAKAAVAAGRREAAVAELEAAIAEGPQPAVLWRMLAAQLFNLGRIDDAERRAAAGLAAHPDDYELTNTLGVALRRLKRLPEAVDALEAAVAMRPGVAAAWQNLGNALLDLRRGERAAQVYGELIRLDPGAPQHRWRLGRALWQQDKGEAAADAMRAALAMAPDNIEAWLDLASILSGEQRLDEAIAVLEDAIRRTPTAARLLEAKAVLLRRSGAGAAALAFLDAAETFMPGAAWTHFQRGQLIGDGDRATANVQLEKAHALAPNNLEYALALAEGLSRDRTASEGESLERAYRLALQALPHNTEPGNKILSEVLGRACDFAALAQVGGFREMGRAFAQAGRHSALLEQIPRVASDADRLELVEQHRIWGRGAQAWAAKAPVARRAPRPADPTLRLGFLSSDLRRHAVGHFALPLFQHRDPRFELFVYSHHPGRGEDPVQTAVAAAATVRNLRGMAANAAAQAIADDGLDLLIELGGSTLFNRIEVMAFRAAPRQASWLGYPHSVGLSCIDWFICDPRNAPQRPELMIEQPLMLPATWIALGEHVFTDEAAIAAEPPSARNGFVTFGTANNPYKYNPATLAAWARVVAATPGSRFMVVRPEAGSAGFRGNIEAAFAAEGVVPERLIWRAVRGGHLAHYGDIDVSLDTFPLTGGTTTTESLWMGVPVVSLVGPAFYERLSFSILTNAGLGDLCARDLDAYVGIATRLAADVERRRALRSSLRRDLRAGPLGRTADFARDFYETMWNAVRGA